MSNRKLYETSEIIYLSPVRLYQEIALVFLKFRKRKLNNSTHKAWFRSSQTSELGIYYNRL